MINDKPIINGIDVSEEIRYCNNCGNLGLDFKTGKFYCSLISHRPDELPEVLSCDDFSANCYIKRLQEENEELKNRLKTLDDEEFVYEVTEIEYNNFKKMNEYKQALEEIREIAKYNQFYNPKYFMLRGDIGQVQNVRMTEIYNKINEVLK